MKHMDKRISIHHIGGRGGSGAFPMLKAFEGDLVNVFYDADPESLEAIKERNALRKSEQHVLPYCLSNECRKDNFKINYDPYTSSFYSINPGYDSYYSFRRDHDYLLKEALKTEEERPVETVTMDHIFHLKGAEILKPDFLSIDTEGSEYEILLGAKEILKENVAAVFVEGAFHQFRKGQKLFGDIAGFLSEQGFDFIRFINLQELSPFRGPIGLRGEGVHAVCDALFFKRLDTVDNIIDKNKVYSLLRKLAFIAIAFNQFEYGLMALEKSRLYGPGDGKEDAVYLRFLKDFEESVKKMPVNYPPSFASKYPTFEASKLRTSNMSKPKKVKKSKILRLPRLFLGTLLFKTQLFLKMIFSKDTDAEKILKLYNLKPQRNLLKTKRIAQTYSLRRSRR